MNDHGYTLAEMLAALVMIGLAVGGLTMGVRVIGHGEASATSASSEGRVLRSVQNSLTNLLDNRGPFRTKDGATFKGAPNGFSFMCNKPDSCGASLTTSHSGTQLEIEPTDGPTAMVTIPGSARVHFVYGGNQTSGADWPPPVPTPDILRSVTLIRDIDDAPIASVHVWRQQPADCAFDPVSGDCRSVTP